MNASAGVLLSSKIGKDGSKNKRFIHIAVNYCRFFVVNVFLRIKISIAIKNRHV